MEEAGVLDKISLVFGQMNEPGNRLRVALTGLTMAEKFRDDGRDVLLFVDNILSIHLGGWKCLRCLSYALSGRVSTNTRRRDGGIARRITTKGGLHHIGASGICTR